MAAFEWLATLAAFCTPTPASQQQDPYETWDLERTESPYFLIEGDPSVDRFPLASTDVQIEVQGVIAEVRVRQVYRNEGDDTLSARYVFPASTRAAVHGMEMRVAERIVRARIAERERARKTYERAKEQGKSASLLEQERPNVFQMDVANVLAGEDIEVELTYTELLVPEGGEYELVFPTVVGPRYSRGDATESWAANPYLREGAPPTSTFSLRASLSTGLPLAALACDTHDAPVTWTSESTAQLTLDPAERHGGDRDFVLRFRLAGDAVRSGLMLQRNEGQDAGHFLLMVQPPERLAEADVPPREYVFVVDVSGSMKGRPLDTARSLVRDLIGSLKPSDTFNVVLFAGGADLLSPASLAATGEHVDRALAFLGSRKGGGGTELASALSRALSLPRSPSVSRSLIVVTDGFVSAERDAFRLLHDNVADSNVFAFGIGSSVNRYLVEGIARVGQGEATVIGETSDARAAVERFRRYVSHPVLTDVRLAAEGFEVLSQEPAGLADLMASRPLVVAGRWRGTPAGTLTLTGVTGAGPFRQVVDVAGVEVATGGPLPYVWARQRVAALADWNFGHPSSEQREEILRLGLTYGLLTDLTSFVAVTEEARTDGVASEETVQPLPLPRGVSDYAVGQAVGKGDEPPLWVVALLGLVALFAVRRSTS